MELSNFNILTIVLAWETHDQTRQMLKLRPVETTNVFRKRLKTPHVVIRIFQFVQSSEISMNLSFF